MTAVTHFWENAYDQTSVPFSCTVDRGTASDTMYMINHYLDKNITFFGTSVPAPNTAELTVTNAATGDNSVGEDADNCASIHGIYPTFVLVDFVSSSIQQVCP